MPSSPHLLPRVPRSHAVRGVFVSLLATVLTASAMAFVATLPAASSPNFTRSVLQHDVDAVHDTGSVGVLAQFSDGTHTITARAGRAELTGRPPVPTDARFRIGSATKPFVATVVLQLVGEGRLSLDDTVDRWLPGMVSGNGNDGEKITIRQLLQHTSGLFDYFEDTASWPQLTSAEGFQANPFRDYRPERLVALAMHHRPYFPPGTGWAYSNTNYVLLGLIINKATGLSWAQQVDRRIIGPLGLHQTTIPGDDPFITGPHAHAYRTYPNDAHPTDVTYFNPSLGDAAGAIISNTTDLNRFLTALIGGELLRPTQLTDLRTTVPTSPDMQHTWPGSRYGLGLMWIPLSCGDGYWSHGGDGLGFSTRDGVTTNANRSVVVSTTSEANDRTDQGTNQLIDHALCTRNNVTGGRYA